MVGSLERRKSANYEVRNKSQRFYKFISTKYNNNTDTDLSNRFDNGSAVCIYYVNLYGKFLNFP